MVRKKTLRKQLQRAYRYVRWKLGLQPQRLCTCLDLWTCGRPHMGPLPEFHQGFHSNTSFNPLPIESLAPLSEREENVFNAGKCTGCERLVSPYQWQKQVCTMKCPWCDHLVDPAPMPDECTCNEPDDTGWVCPIHPKKGSREDKMDRADRSAG